jgi:hypothetical protein
MIDTKKFREANQGVREKLELKRMELTDETYNIHMETLRILDEILDFVEESMDTESGSNTSDTDIHFTNPRWNSEPGSVLFSASDIMKYIKTDIKVTTTPSKFEYSEQFEDFFKDPAIASFGRWMQANGEAYAKSKFIYGIEHKIPYLVIGKDI